MNPTMIAAAQGQSPYQFKPGPYSSHGLLLAEFPAQGHGASVLDLGCASGYLSAALSGRAFRVTGIDLPGCVPPPGVQFIPADLDRGLPPLSTRFDYILCADLLEHLRDPVAFLRQCRDCLAPSGALIASLPNSGHAYFRWMVLTGRFPQHDRGLFDRTHLHFYTFDGWTGLLARAGFRCRRVVSSGVPIGLALPGWQDTAPVHWLERLSFLSARAWKRLFAYQFIVRAVPENNS